MLQYQNLKIFNKDGLEVPLFWTSNIIITNENSIDTINDKSLLMYGVCEMINDEIDIVDVQVQQGGVFKDRSDIITSLSSLNAIINDVFYPSCINININDVSIDTLHVDDGSDDHTFVSLNNTNIDTINFVQDFDKSVLIYPSLVFNCHVSLPAVSTELIETETLLFGQILDNLEFVNLYNNASSYKIVCEIDETSHIKIFDYNTVSESVNWYNSHELSSDNALNIGFTASTEGCYEGLIEVFISNNQEKIKIGEISVDCEAIGEDERFRALLGNFGILEPYTYYNVFKASDIDECYPDWQLLNQKSKEMMLTYDKIFPYVGTYKALINAIKYLGYDDIYFREWYKVFNYSGLNEKVSIRLDINEKFDDINLADYIIKFDDELTDEARNHIYKKKLNQLSMIYKINRENGEFDNYNIPIVENVYQHSITDVIVKLFALKRWLERNIIAVNCKIIDITGEGVVYEKMSYQTYGTTTQVLDYEDILEINPKVESTYTKLIDGSANIRITTLPSSSEDFITLSEIENYSLDQFDGTIDIPFINTFKAKAYIDTSSAILSNGVSKPIWINDGEMQFMNVNDVVNTPLYLSDGDNINESNLYLSRSGRFVKESIFTSLPIIQIERGYLRNDGGQWSENIMYSIDRSADKASYKITKHFGEDNGIYKSSTDYIILYPTEQSSLKYTIDNTYEVPVLKIKGYKYVLYSINNRGIITSQDVYFDTESEYILDIIDGKILMPKFDNKIEVINFNYDYAANEQHVSLTCEYSGSFVYDIKNDENGCAHLDVYCDLNVNNIGKYRLIVYAHNKFNNIFAKEILSGCEVYVDKSNISIYNNCDTIINSSDFYNESLNGIESSLNIHNNDTIYDNSKPIFREQFLSREITIINDFNDERYCIQYPSMTYANDTAKDGDIINLISVVDVCKIINQSNIDGEIQLRIKSAINKYTIDDEVNIVIYDKLYHDIRIEFGGKITNYIDDIYIVSVIDDIDIDIMNLMDANYNLQSFIMPVSYYEVTGLEQISSSNTRIIVDSSVSIFNNDDVIKLKYTINKLQDTSIYLDTRSNNVLVLDDTQINPIYHKKLYDVELLDPSTYYDGYASFRVIGQGKTTIKKTQIDEYGNPYTITVDQTYYDLDNKFVYNDYARYKSLMGKYVNLILGNYVATDDNGQMDPVHINEELNDRRVYIASNDIINSIIEIDESAEIIGTVYGKYINAYGETTDESFEVKYKDSHVKYNDRSYTLFPFRSALHTSHAHQKFVGYKMKSNYSVEYDNGYTRIFTDYNRLYNYIDGTFGLYISRFNHYDAYDFWMNDISVINSNKWFKYEKPVTISSDNSDIILTSENEHLINKFTVWEVYKNVYNNQRNLLFEVMNDKLLLSISKPGIYDVISYDYDMFGNKVMTEKYSIIKRDE